MRSLPYPHAEQLVITLNCYPKAGVDRGGSSLPNYYDRRHLIKAFASTSIDQPGDAIVGEAGSPNRIPRDRVSPEFFATLGVPLRMGRSFAEGELDYARSGVAVITDSFWHSNFNADPHVIGRKFQVDSLPVEVVGVLPAGFRYLSSKAQFYIPYASDKDERGLDRRHSNNCDLIARLAPGATLSVAQAQIDALNAQQIKDDPYSKLLIGAGFHTSVRLLPRGPRARGSPGAPASPGRRAVSAPHGRSQPCQPAPDPRKRPRQGAGRPAGPRGQPPAHRARRHA